MFIHELGHARGSARGSAPPTPRPLMAETAGLERLPPLLATGVTPWRLRIQIGCRNYIGRYGAYSQGTRVGGSSRIPICFTLRIRHGMDHLHMAPPPPRWWSTLAAMLPGIIPQDVQHPRWPGFKSSAGHPGGTAWQLRRHASNGDQDHQPGLLTQYFGIRHDVFARNNHDCWQRTGGSGTGLQIPDPGLEREVDALPQDECGELWGRLWQKMDPACWRTPPHYNLEHLPHLEDALSRFRDQDPIVLRNLNANIGQSQNPHSQHVADLLMECRMVDPPPHHFCQNLWFCHLKMWSHVWQRRLLPTRCDYILG